LGPERSEVMSLAVRTAGAAGAAGPERSEVMSLAVRTARPGHAGRAEVPVVPLTMVAGRRGGEGNRSAKSPDYECSEKDLELHRRCLLASSFLGKPLVRRCTTV